MLPKIWKKVLLAICIIACIYNIMSKLVNRHSLESNLRSANDGNTVLDAIKEENKIENELKEENELNVQNDNNSNKDIDSSNSQEKQNNIENEEEQQQQENNGETEIDLTNTEDLWDSSEKEVYRYRDYVVTF